MQSEEVTITQSADRGVTSFYFPLMAGGDRWFLLSSDWHWDNPKCDRALLESHLQQAQDCGAKVLVFGDLFCGMEGKGDPRGAKNVRPEHNNASYLDSLVDTFAEWIAPYRDSMGLITYGNHETAILNRKETDLIRRVGERMGIPYGCYSGWVRWMASRGAGEYRTIKGYYHHGYGGGGPVTKGVIGTNRRAAYVDDADLIISGHVHEAWIMDLVSETCTQKGEIRHKTTWHVQCPSYKDESTGGNGFHVEKGRPPKPLGAWWLRLYYSPADHNRIGIELSRAS